MYTVENGIVTTQEQPENWQRPYAITAAELIKKDIPPINWIIDGLLPEGVAMLAAPPKSFKSFMCLDMAVKVAQGLPFFGRKTQKGSVVYFDLESGERRPRDRLKLINAGYPDNLVIIPGSAQVGKLGAGFEQTLADAVIQHDARLVIVDVMKSIRPPMKSKQTLYEKDYDDIAPLAQVAQARHAAILLVNHTVKMKQADVFNQVSGSVGIFGALDTMFVIDREDRRNNEATLYVQGRDVEPQELAIEWQPFQWHCKGSAEDVQREREVAEYEANPIRLTIVELVKKNGGHWQGSASEIKEESQYLNGKKHKIYAATAWIGRFISSHKAEFQLIDEIIPEPDRISQNNKWIFNSINSINSITSITSITSIENE